ncbi:MAG: M48 family metalloprotease [Gomphosphaeria aponina SAG 52.96 = DSM 107014]|uniref:M48 family metalloprotease n=1 Tax=Gomphosphaeria aponina SAG 52.96 = DSM 107014 TaxID=1521640 RepID=A0A941GPX2_9CHRO|nr:M48 family metalloprotease [Gomphosphaeria aponina SAG 52.96 = DSM 107014]
MFKQLFSRRRWLYGLLGVVTALFLHLGNLSPIYSFSWEELILRGVQILQLSHISDEQEVGLGEQINQQLLSEGEVQLADDPQINAYLKEIGQKLAQNSDRPELPYTFQVVDDESINAFATMGGFVYIHTGLMVAAANEAELASVVAHEIGHLVARHSLKQMRQRALAEGLLSAAGLDEKIAVQIGVELALHLPHSRGAELEADQLGLANLRQAGYAPLAMVTFMEKLQQQGGSAPTLLSTHPATSDRIVALQEQIDPNTAYLGQGLNEQAYKNHIRPLL